jgi:trk system potassium uptake protein TrkA
MEPTNPPVVRQHKLGCEGQMATRKKRNFVVVGLGAFGGTIATTLSGLGDEVLGIDHDETRVRDHIDKVTHAVIADARDEDALREAGVEQYDVAVISIGEALEASILCTMNLKLLGVPIIWVKAMSRTHHRILTKLGVDRVIRPERDMGLHVAETLHTPFVADYLSLGNSFHIINLIVPGDRKIDTLAQLVELAGESVGILGLMRGTEFISSTKSDSQLREGDRLMILGKRDHLRHVASLL